MGRLPEETDKKCLEEEEEGEDCCDGSGGDGSPDGGWGWMVMLASFGCIMVVDGISFSFTYIMKEISEEFPKVSLYDLAWIGSSLPGTYLLVGPFVSALCARYSCRRVTICGSLISAFAFWVSTQSPNIEFFIISYSVMGGVGFGMIYLPSIVSVGYWFDKKRAFATGAALCGSGAGQFLFAPLLQYLKTEYTWQGMVLIMAGIVLNCVVCGAMFFPLRKRQYFRRLCPHHVEIERGAIMKALIEEKKRQRTISNGSLDNCVITQQNTLIKLDKKLFEMKRNDSFIARFKRQLGFSSQSLNNSKTSVIPSIVIDAVKQEHNNRTSGSPVFRGSQNMRVTQLSQASLPKRGSFPDSGVCVSGDKRSATLTNGCVPLGGSADKICMHKTQSCEEGIWMKQGSGGSSGVESAPRCFSLENTAFPASGMDTRSTSAASIQSSTSGISGMASLEGSIVSIQVIPNLNTSNRSMAGRNIRQRSSQSESAVPYSVTMSNCNSPMSSCCGSIASVPAIQASIEELEHEYARQTSMLFRWGSILLDMVAFRLLANKVFLLLILSSMVTLLAFMSPYLLLPRKGEALGMTGMETSMILSVIGVTNTLGRVVSGWLSDRPWVNTFCLNNLSLICAGMSILLVPMCNTINMVVAVAAIFGFSIAVFHSLRSILLVELLGLDTLTKSFGVLSLFQGIANFVGLPLLGWFEQDENTDNAFYLSGGLLVLSALLMMPIRCLRSERDVDRRHITPYAATPLPVNELKQQGV